MAITEQKSTIFKEQPLASPGLLITADQLPEDPVVDDDHDNHRAPEGHEGRK